MPTALVPRAQITDGSLPSVCVICGGEAPHRRFAGVEGPSLAWVFVAPLVGLLSFWAYVLAKGKGKNKDERGGIPFCDRHLRYWPRRAWFITLGFANLVLAFVAIGISASFEGKGETASDPFLGIYCCFSIPVFLVLFLWVHLSAVRPTGGDANYLRITGADQNFINALTNGVAGNHG